MKNQSTSRRGQPPNKGQNAWSRVVLHSEVPLYLLNLDKEGQMLRNTSDEYSELWGQALLRLGDEQLNFVLNGALDTTPQCKSPFVEKERK